MAFWDKYEGRSPLLITGENRELYHLKPDDRLFKGDPDSAVWIDIDSPLDRYGSDRPKWYAYVWGFKDAADRLIEDLVKEGKPWARARFLGNPIMTLYRHSVELAIKSILITAGVTDGLKGHDLNRLWEKAVETMAKEEPKTTEDEWIRTVGAIITELNEADANSELFRYGVDKKLKAYERRVDHVDVVNLRRVMDKLANGLEGCDTWLYEMRQARWEYEADMRQEYYEEMHQAEADMRQEYYEEMRGQYGSPNDYY